MPSQTALTAALAGLGAAGGRRDAPTPGSAAVPRGGRPSLLYDPRAAADIGLDTLHEVGVSGNWKQKKNGAGGGGRRAVGGGPATDAQKRGGPAVPYGRGAMRVLRLAEHAQAGATPQIRRGWAGRAARACAARVGS